MTWKTFGLILAATGTTLLVQGQETNLPPQNQDTNLPPATTAERMLDKLTAQQFVTDAAMGGMKEVRLSELAMANTQNGAVRNFAHRMIVDHSKVNRQLIQLAQQKGLELPATNTFAPDDPNWRNPMLTGSEEVKDAYLLKTNLAMAAYLDFKLLKPLTGKEFDQAYAKDMVLDHVNTVIEFEAASRLLTDPELKQFAQQTLPSLREHSRMARKLVKDLDQTQTSDSENPNDKSEPMAKSGSGM